VFGENDAIVPPESTLALAAAFEGACHMPHPGGHGIPTGADYRKQVADFLESVRGEAAPIS